MALIFNIEYSARFDSDIKNIYEYIANNLQNPEAASAQVSRIMFAAETLAVFPKIFRVRRFDFKGRELRFFPVDNYIVIYSVDDRKNIVKILRVIYGKRNLDEII